PGLEARVAYPYSLPLEASTEGGGVWQDNLDGTFTQLRDGYFVPASGYSYLDLYLMGLIAAAEVPDFFIVRPLARIGTDANGRPIFKGQRMRITIQDVIAAEGPRLPDVNHSQRHFNTGIVVIVEHGRTPSAELINRANGIRRQWIDYWAITTGRRASMTVDPHRSNQQRAAQQADEADDRPRFGPTGHGGGALRVLALRRAPGARSLSAVFGQQVLGGGA